MMLANGQRLRRRNCFADELTRFAVGNKCENRFNLGVLWKGPGARKKERAPRIVQTVLTLFCLPQPIDYAVSVAHKECCCVDEHAVAFRCFDFESPQNGLRE